MKTSKTDDNELQHNFSGNNPHLMDEDSNPNPRTDSADNSRREERTKLNLDVIIITNLRCQFNQKTSNTP